MLDATKAALGKLVTDDRFSKSRKFALNLAVGQSLLAEAERLEAAGKDPVAILAAVAPAFAILSGLHGLGIAIEDHGEKNSGNYGKTKYEQGWRRRKD